VSSVFAATRIAQSIADRLAPAIPKAGHVTLTVTGSELRVVDGATSIEVDLSAFGTRGALSARDAETAVRAALSTIQDVVQEALTVPWPAPDALPDAVARDGILSAWFGSEDAPVLRIDDVTELSR